MAKRIGPEARIIQLFTALPDDSKRIVMDVLKAQTATPRKKAADPKSAPSAGKRSSRKEGTTESTQSIEALKANASTVSSGRCVICGNDEAYSDHQPDAASYHIFRTGLKAKKAPKPETIVLPDNPEGFHHGATA